MSELRIRVFESLSQDEVDTVNDFLKEMGDSVVKVDSHATGYNNSFLNFVVTYKHSKYNSTNSDIRVEYLSYVSDLNKFLEEIGDRFISKEISECHHYVTYYVPKTTDDNDNDNKKEKTDDERKVEQENALG